MRTRRLLSPRSIALAVVAVLGLVGSACTPGGGGGASASHFCQALKENKIWASQGAQIHCFGAQRTSARAPRAAVAPNAPVTPDNVRAANLAEDVSPTGVRGYGQSETSVAANGPYVVEAWNDATGFVSPCPSPQYKEELTGLAFSADGGHTFTDLGGLPNNDCNAYVYQGDPTVETATIGGVRYFYIGSLFNGGTTSKLALSVCTASGIGASANLACGQPVVVAQSSQCVELFPGFTECGFLDKDFLTVDPVRHRLYMSYTEFTFDPNTFDQFSSIELAACNIKSPTVPICRNGRGGANARPPYLVVTPPRLCENEGSYPAVDVKTGDVYVAYEHNIDTAFFDPRCQGQPVRQIVKRIPFSSLTLPTASGGPASSPRSTSRR